MGTPSSRRLRGRREDSKVKSDSLALDNPYLAKDIASDICEIPRRKKLRGWLRRRYSSDRLESVADRLERAAQVAALSKPESEANRNNAEAIARLLEASRDTPTFIAISESILFIKVTDNRGPRVFAKTLTATELRMIDDHKIPLADPQRVLDILGSGHQETAGGADTPAESR